tara:strand:+ start:50 stop:322 length:273 start_codon:yes stop_codon:yes gene_type:complete
MRIKLGDRLVKENYPTYEVTEIIHHEYYDSYLNDIIVYKELGSGECFKRKRHELEETIILFNVHIIPKNEIRFIKMGLKRHRFKWLNVYT